MQFKILFRHDLCFLSICQNFSKVFPIVNCLLFVVSMLSIFPSVSSLCKRLSIWMSVSFELLLSSRNYALGFELINRSEYHRSPDFFEPLSNYTTLPFGRRHLHSLTRSLTHVPTHCWLVLWWEMTCSYILEVVAVHPHCPVCRLLWSSNQDGLSLFFGYCRWFV